MKTKSQIVETFKKCNSQVLLRRVESGKLKKTELNVANQILSRRGLL